MCCRGTGAFMRFGNKPWQIILFSQTLFYCFVPTFGTYYWVPCNLLVLSQTEHELYSLKSTIRKRPPTNITTLYAHVWSGVKQSVLSICLSVCLLKSCNVRVSTIIAKHHNNIWIPRLSVREYMQLTFCFSNSQAKKKEEGRVRSILSVQLSDVWLQCSEQPLVGSPLRQLGGGKVGLLVSLQTCSLSDLNSKL